MSCSTMCMCSWVKSSFSYLVAQSVCDSPASWLGLLWTTGVGVLHRKLMDARINLYAMIKYVDDLYKVMIMLGIGWRWNHTVP